MGVMTTTPDPNIEDRDGSDEEVDDQFRALMEGLRTTIPGVIVLFSFLLILPFQTSFGELRGPNTVVFYVAFTTSALAAIMMIAPAVHQRVRAPRSGIKRRTWSHVMFATKLAIVGTVAHVVSITAVVYLVSSVVFTDRVAVIATALIAATVAWAWFYIPLFTFRNDGD
jgi:hypothetical protein